MTKEKRFVIMTKSSRQAGMAQSVEHVIGNDEVISSILITSSIVPRTKVLGTFFTKKAMPFVLRLFWHSFYLYIFLYLFFFCFFPSIIANFTNVAARKERRISTKTLLVRKFFIT